MDLQTFRANARSEGISPKWEDEGDECPWLPENDPPTRLIKLSLLKPGSTQATFYPWSGSDPATDEELAGFMVLIAKDLAGDTSFEDFKAARGYSESEIDRVRAAIWYELRAIQRAQMAGILGDLYAQVLEVEWPL